MKKMVCEICESQKIRKENDVFVCLECGTEYDIESAKKLLREISENSQVINGVDNNSKVQIIEENDKYKLLNHLLLWAEYIVKLEKFRNDFDVRQDNSNSFYFNDSSYYNPNFMKDFYYEHFDLMPLTSESFVTSVKEAINRTKSSGKIKYAYNFYKSLEDAEITVPNSAVEIFNLLKTKYVVKQNVFGYRKGDSLFRASFSGPYEGGGIAYWDYRVNINTTVREWVKEICIPNINYVYRSSKNPKVDGRIFQRKNGFFGPKDVCILDLTSVLVEIKNMYDKIPYKLAPLYMNLFNKECKQMVEERCNILMDLINAAPELEKTFMLPYQYRTSYIIIELINLVYEGKAETWKELINLYDTIVYRNQNLYQLSLITEEIKKINNHLLSINKSLNEIDNTLLGIKQSMDMMNENIQKSNDLLKKTSQNTFGIMLELL